MSANEFLVGDDGAGVVVGYQGSHRDASTCTAGQVTRLILTRADGAPEEIVISEGALAHLVDGWMARHRPDLLD